MRFVGWMTRESAESKLAHGRPPLVGTHLVHGVVSEISAGRGSNVPMPWGWRDGMEAGAGGTSPAAGTTDRKCP